MKGPLTAYLLALVTGGLVIYVELASQYPRTQKFAFCNRVAICYFFLHAILSAVLFQLILSFKDIDLIGKFVFDEPHLKALAAGLQWQALLRLRIFTFRTPGGKDVPIGVELFWERIAKLFERKLEEKEETALFDFLRSYKQKYQDVKAAKDIALQYLGLGLSNLEKGEMAAMRKKFEGARTSEEVMYTFVRFRGVKVFEQRFPLV